MLLLFQNTYKIESRPKGQCLIINNEIFKHLSHRKGSQIDVENLEMVFSTLGFYVTIESNLKKVAMEQRLELFAKQTIHTDMIILIILSHGENGKILCEDYHQPSNPNLDAFGEVGTLHMTLGFQFLLWKYEIQIF